MTAAMLILALLYTASLILRRWLALSYAKKLPPMPAEPLPPDTLTVLQAILSGDPLLEARLEVNLKNLPQQPFLWLIDEDDAEARRIAERLQRANVHVILCPPCPDATNPKLWKLQIASPQVRTPFLAVIDDDTTISAVSAAALVEAAKGSTVATGLPCYEDGGDVASGLLAQFVNNNSVFTYLGTSRLLRPFTLNGMGYVMRRTELERIGGFEPILNELTDDLALATHVLKHGGSIHQSAAPLQVRTGVKNLRHYMQMMHRWYVFTLLLLRKQPVKAQVVIFLLHGLPPMLLGASFVLMAALNCEVLGITLLFYLLFFTGMLGPFLSSILSPAGLVLMLWMGIAPDAYLLLIMLFLRGALLPSIQHMFFGKDIYRTLLSLVSELIQPVHLLHAACVRTIRWRTRLYCVRDTHDFHAA